MRATKTTPCSWKHPSLRSLSASRFLFCYLDYVSPQLSNIDIKIVHHRYYRNHLCMSNYTAVVIKGSMFPLSAAAKLEPYLVTILVTILMSVNTCNMSVNPNLYDNVNMRGVPNVQSVMDHHLILPYSRLEITIVHLYLSTYATVRNKSFMLFCVSCSNIRAAISNYTVNGSAVGNYWHDGRPP